MSKTQLLVHLVFSTKCREKSINPEYKRELYGYILGILNNKNCKTVRINGMADHVHILFDLHPSLAVADLVRIIKGSTSDWMKNNPNFRKFKGWGVGYYAVSIGREEKDRCRQYIMNQEEHHKDRSLMIELETMIRAYEMDWFPDDWQ